MCPFRTAADRRPDIDYSLHLGLIRDALGEMGASVETTGLERSPVPHPCIASFLPRQRRT
jgi:hypothetical protein